MLALNCKEKRILNYDITEVSPTLQYLAKCNLNSSIKFKHAVFNYPAASVQNKMAIRKQSGVQVPETVSRLIIS